jgi:hypothetical protein
VVAETQESVNRIKRLADILWGFIEDLERTGHLIRKPTVEKALRISHAISQLSAAYLKVAEAEVVMATVPELKAQVRQLMESRNVHGQAAERTDIH